MVEAQRKIKLPVFVLLVGRAPEPRHLPAGAGPLRTLAGRGAGVDDMLGLYQHMSPMGRNITHEEVGKAGAWLLSRDSQGITGEILHVDAGYNIMGSPGRLLDLVPKQAE